MSCDSFTKCSAGTNFFIYLSHFLSAWGDRMWSFGVGLFLINISPESLQLTASHGLAMGVSILMFGALIGDIVDKTARLKAAQRSLLLQNFFVVADAVVIYLYLIYSAEITSTAPWAKHAGRAVIILLSVLSRLASIARTIAVEKDWIVEICGQDFDKLASMTASLRRIDLTTQVLAPIATGFIMTYGVKFGALFIGGWNLVSVLVEYYFLWKVYNTVPALRKKKDFSKAQIAALAEDEKDVQNDQQLLGEMECTDIADKSVEAETESQQVLTLEAATNLTGQPKLEVEQELPEASSSDQVAASVQDSSGQNQRGCKCLKKLSGIERLYQGWPIYIHYPAVHAGLGLACLYMTVLGFDSVTVGYAKMQGVSEGLLGVMMGIAAFFGIFGTYMYPFMRKGLGLTRTGIFGLSIEVMCLLPCIASVWMPGSHFDLSQGFHPDRSKMDGNCSQDLSNLTSYSSPAILNSSLLLPLHSGSNATSQCISDGQEVDSPISTWMLLAGIVTARFGLWVADLAISQIFLETVEPTERGKVNGVQSSLNQLMDLLKFVMVVVAPYQHQFGLLVIISFAFICIGWLFYAYFLRKTRGHFFHFEKCLKLSFRNAHPNEISEVELQT